MQKLNLGNCRTLFSRPGRNFILPFLFLALLFVTLGLYAWSAFNAAAQQKAADDILDTRLRLAHASLDSELERFQRQSEEAQAALRTALADRRRGGRVLDPSAPAGFLPAVDTLFRKTLTDFTAIRTIQLVLPGADAARPFGVGPYTGQGEQQALIRQAMASPRPDGPWAMDLLSWQGETWLVRAYALSIPPPPSPSGASGQAPVGPEGRLAVLLFATSLDDLLAEIGQRHGVILALLDPATGRLLSGNSVAVQRVEGQDQHEWLDQLLAGEIRAVWQGDLDVQERHVRWLAFGESLAGLPRSLVLIAGLEVDATALPFTGLRAGILWGLLVLGLAVTLYGISRAWQAQQTLDRLVQELNQAMARVLGREEPLPVGDAFQALAQGVRRLEAGVRELLAGLEAKLAQQEQLQEITAQFKERLSLDDAISMTADIIWQMPEVDFVAVLIGEGELGPYRYVGVRGTENPLALLGQSCTLPLWGVLAQAVVRKPGAGEPDFMLIDDIEQENRPRPEEFPWLPPRGSVMIFPMREENRRAFGAVILGSHTPGALHRPELWRHFSAVVAWATRAIRDALYQEQTTRWVNQLVSLQLFTRKITGLRDVEEILLTLGTELSEMFGEIAVHVFLESSNAGFSEEESQRIPVTHVTDYSVHLVIYSISRHWMDDEQFVRTPKLLRLVNWVLEAGQPIFYEPAEPIVDPTELYYRDRGHALLVPIASSENGSPIGVIRVSATERVKPFTESDMVVLRTVTNSVATALSNARLYRQLSEARYREARLLARIVDGHAGDPVGHCERVALYAEALARRLRLPPPQLQAVGMAAALHEIDRLSSLDASQALAQFRPSNGTEPELSIQPEAVEDILADLGFGEEVIQLVSGYRQLRDQASEPSNGTGASTPRREEGALEDASLEVRIIAVADWVDSHLPEMPATGVPDLERWCEQLTGQQDSPDPDLVALFCQLIRSGLVPFPRLA